MKHYWIMLAALGALLLPAPGMSLTVATTADADGAPCCGGGPSRTITHHSYQYSDVEPGRWEQPISWKFAKAFSCLATRGSQIDGGSVTINLMGNERTLTHIRPKNCPFDLKSFSELWIHNWGQFPLVYSKATSFCSQPCNEC